MRWPANSTEWRGAFRTLTGLVLFVTAQPSAADEFQSSYFEGLRQRELYRVAEEYAERQLAQPRLSSKQRIELTIALSQALCQHARLTRDSSAPQIWDEAQRVLADLTVTELEPPEQFALQLQRCRIPCERMQSLHFEWQIHPTEESGRQQTLEYATAALNDLRAFMAALDQTGAVQHKSWTTIFEILRTESQLLLAQVYLTRGELQLNGPDRVGDWAEAAKLLDILMRNQRMLEIQLESRLLRAKVARLQQDDVKSAALLQSLLADNAKTPQRLKDAAVAEFARLKLSAGRPDEALGTLAARLQQPAPVAPEVRAQVIESLLATWQAAQRQGRADLQTGLIERAEQELAITGGQWHRWAARRIEQVKEERDLGPELAALMQRSRTAFQAGRLSEAIDTLQTAIATAQRLGLHEKAVELVLMCGALQLQSEQFDAAARTFGSLETLDAAHPRIAEADLLRCFSLGKLVDQSATPAHLAQFSNALDRHLARFGSQTTAVEALWMLGLLKERQHSPWDAWNAYARIPPQHAKAPAALERMLSLLEAAPADSQTPTEVNLNQKLIEVQELFQQSAPVGSRLTLGQAHVATRIAALMLRHLGELSSTAPQISSLSQRAHSAYTAEVRAAETSELALDPGWNSIRQRLLGFKIVLLAAQNESAEAHQLVTELQQDNPTESLQILQRLTELSTHLGESDQPALGRLQLQIAGELNTIREQLTLDQQSQLEDCLIGAHMLAGNFGEALQRIEASGRIPKVAQLEALTVAVLQGGGPAHLQRIRELWMQLESQAPKGTNAWFQARLVIVQVLFREGSVDDGLKLIKVTRLIYPALGGAELKAKFEALLNEIPQSP